MSFVARKCTSSTRCGGESGQPGNSVGEINRLGGWKTPGHLSELECRVERHIYFPDPERWPGVFQDRKSTRLNSSHRCISYAVFCLKKKKKNRFSKTVEKDT